MNWLQVLFDNLKQLVPYTWIRQGQKGVFYRFGIPLFELGPGLWDAVWGIERIEVEWVNIDTLNLPTQSETTNDGVEVSYSANIIYEVENLIKKQTEVRDFDSSLENLCMIHLARVVRGADYEWLRAHRDSVEKKIRKIARIYASRWGVRIHTVGMTDFVRPQHMRHMGDVILHA